MKTKHSNASRGFTVIELIFVITLLGAAALLFFVQRTNLEVADRDEHRKIAVNAIYYNLEEVFYPRNKYYPQALTAQDLTAMDSSLLTDTNNVGIDAKIDTSGYTQETIKALEGANLSKSEYRYEAADCNDEGKCKSYTLRVSLENEAEFVKKSRNK